MQIMLETPFLPRIAYIRTVLESDRDSEETTRFLQRFVRQPSNKQTSNGQPRHRFLFSAFNIVDAHILDICIADFATSTQTRPFLDVEKEDLELRMSSTFAASNAGKRVLGRCKTNGIRTKLCGDSDKECDELMLEESDYLIDGCLEFGYTDWFFNHVQPGIPQDTMLTNPDYDVSRHDHSGLHNRIEFSVWSRNSGCFHGNPEWRCGGCGGKCKRGRCRLNPPPDTPAPSYAKLPPCGSVQWRDLTAADICLLFWRQTRPGAHPDRDNWESIDTFSGL
jgi:hypothetical protein